MRPLLVLIALAGLALPASAGAASRTIAPLPSSWQKGADVTGFRWNDFDRRTFKPWMRQLRNNAHADYAMFTTRWFQYWRSDPLRRDDAQATEISPAYGSDSVCAKAPAGDQTRCQTPSIESETKAIEYAKSLGLRIAIKPLIDVGRDTSSAAPRESIKFSTPEQLRAWFDSYKYMLSQYARLARDTEADTLVIGTGLSGMTNDADEQDEWRAIIAQIRSGELMGDDKGGFDGKLTYAARWDSIYTDAATPIDYKFFWDALDAIGVEGFWSLTRGKGSDDPTVSRLRVGWAQNFVKGGVPPAIALRALNQKYGKPVVITGLGYLSRGGTAADPSKGDEAQRQAGGKINTEAQARAYRAAFDFWALVARREGWFRGIYWWNWSPTVTDFANGDYSPQGKPAETELCLRQLGRFTRSCRPSKRP